MRLWKNEDGVGIVMALAIAIIVFSLGATWYAVAYHELDEVTLDRNRTSSLSVAESGVRQAMHYLADNTVLSTTAAVPAIPPAVGPLGLRDVADLQGTAGFSPTGASAGTCNLDALIGLSDNSTVGEYWVRVESLGDLRYLIESWGWAPTHTARQANVKKLAVEIELVPLGGFRHALFASEGGLMAGNRKEIYGDAYSGSDVSISNFTRLFPNEAPHRGAGNMTVYEDFYVSGGSNFEIAGILQVNGNIQDLNSGTSYRAVTIRGDSSLTSLAETYFKKASVDTVMDMVRPTASVPPVGVTYDPSSNVTGTVHAGPALGISDPGEFPGISLPDFNWNSSSYGITPVIHHASWADFALWFTTHKGSLSGAHRVPEGGTIDFKKSVFADDFVMVVDGSLTIKGTPAGTTSSTPPVTVAIVMNDPTGHLDLAQSANSIPDQVHHLIFSKGSFGASQQTTIYGAIYGYEDTSANRLEIHFRSPSDSVVKGFVFDPKLADRYISEPVVWRELPFDQPHTLPCALP